LPARQVQVFLRNKHLLLVLDNVEQVLDCASFVADLLASCPRLFILVTSRMPLRLRAEQEFPLAPLVLEDAVTLFCERAQAGGPGREYAVSEVAAICEQVDRLPLVIELAAIHVKVLSLPELRKQLTHRLALLRGGARDLPARQQTMEGAIAWSYELLAEHQQRCFRALGVFVGGWTLEAAEAVGFAEGETTEAEVILTLAALVDASLIQTETVGGGVIRFQMLELIRDYALQRLHAAGEEEQCRRRHAAYYARLAEAVFAYFGPEPGVRDAHFAQVMAQELPNVRAALQWAEERQEAELGLRLTGFVRLWQVRGQMSEAERWMERMLALDLRAREQGAPTAPLPLRIQVLYGVGRTMVRHGKVEGSAEAFAKEALHLAQQIDDHNGISNAYATLGMIAQASGKLDEAEAAYTESLTHARLIGHSGLLSAALHLLGGLAGLRGDAARATALLEEALAKARYREALVLYRAFGSPTYIAACLDGYAATACAEGHYAQATRLCAQASALREQTQTQLLPADREAFEQVVATARAALDEPAFVREWDTGIRLTQDEAIDDALSEEGMSRPLHG
jgi:predicted ATPase